MPVDQPFNVYREQLTSLYHGHALWEPSPIKSIYDQVSIGDVGYVTDGFFYRMFNVTLPSHHPANKRLGEPDHYNPLDWGPFANIREATLAKGDHYSRNVFSQENADNRMAWEPRDAEGSTYKCRGPGALLSLPHDGYRTDVIRTKVFEDYIRDHVVSWFDWSKKIGLGVERMEELILVTGCTMVTSWGATAFVDHSQEAEISLAVQALPNGGGSYDWSKIHRAVAYHNSRPDPNNPSPTPNQCVFIRGFRAKRRLFWTVPIRAAAEPLPDDPDNNREDDIQVTRVPNAPKYRDPLVGVLDYIAEKCPEDTIAIAHDDDLPLIENETPTANTVERFLNENQIPVLIENGAAILGDSNDDTPPVPEESKAIFYAAAELAGELVPLVVHPVLTKYLLKLEISEHVDLDYELPKEEMSSPAVHPPMPSLTLESHQGYPQPINAQASSDAPGVGVSVQDVLSAIHEDMRKPSPRRIWNKLSDGERAVINASFKERCKTEEQLSKGPSRFDHLRGRDRLQIFPKLTSDGVMLPVPELFPAVFVDESRVAGPSRSATVV